LSDPPLPTPPPVFPVVPLPTVPLPPAPSKVDPVPVPDGPEPIPVPSPEPPPAAAVVVVMVLVSVVVGNSLVYVENIEEVVTSFTMNDELVVDDVVVVLGISVEEEEVEVVLELPATGMIVVLSTPTVAMLELVVEE